MREHIYVRIGLPGSKSSHISIRQNNYNHIGIAIAPCVAATSCNLYIQCILAGAPTRIRSQSLRTVGNLWPGHHEQTEPAAKFTKPISYPMWPSTCRLDDVSISLSSVTKTHKHAFYRKQKDRLFSE